MVQEIKIQTGVPKTENRKKRERRINKTTEIVQNMIYLLKGPSKCSTVNEKRCTPTLSSKFQIHFLRDKTDLLHKVLGVRMASDPW